MIRDETVVRVKIAGPRRAVEKLVRLLETIFPLLVASPLRANDRDSGVHVFINLNPFLAKTSEEVKEK